MRKFFYTIVFLMAISSGANAQNNQQPGIPAGRIEAVTAKIENKNLMINWNSNSGEQNYWEVQGSLDGKSFSTIGMVMGKDPSLGGKGYSFKMPLSKVKKGVKFFRVLEVDTPETAIASNTIRVSK